MRIASCIVLAVLLVLNCLQSLSADEVRCPVTADVWISAYPAEVNHSMGKTPQLKLKGYGEWSLMRFDVSAIAHKKLIGGRLYMHGARPWMDLGKKAEDPKTGEMTYEAGIKEQRYKVNSLRLIGLSTVSNTWVEGTMTADYQEDPEGKGATFLTPSTGTGRFWAWDNDSNLSDVISTNGNTLIDHTELRKEPDGDGRWFSVPVSPALLQALVSGDSDGLAVIDESGQTMENNFIHSREQTGFEPYLVVTTGADDTAPPAPPTDLQLTPYPAKATLHSGAAQLTFAADAFAAFVKVNGADWPRWKTVHPQNGVCRMVLDGCEPGAEITVELVLDDGQGNKTEPVIITGQASAAVKPPEALPAVTVAPKKGEPQAHGPLTVWAVPGGVKVDPVSGSIHHNDIPGDDYRQANHAWSGQTGSVFLNGVRGEIIAFQLVLEGAASDIMITPGPLSGPDGAVIPGSSLEVYREWYIRTEPPKKKGKAHSGRDNRMVDGWNSEIAIPLADVASIDIPDKVNAVPGQTNQSIWVDIIIPKDIPAGNYTGSIAIAAEGIAPFGVNLNLKVNSFIIPDELAFTPVMNTYLRHGDDLFDVYRACHKHRVELHRTAMGMRLRSRSSYMTPEIEGDDAELRVSDWNHYDKVFGPLLDGSLFKDLPRGPVPVQWIRLPFCEDWPSSHDAGYTYREPYYRDLRSPGETAPAWMVETHHALTGPLVTPDAYTDAYRAGIARVLRDFIMHYRDKGWTRTQMIIMPNSKIYYRNKWQTSAMWRYDEPMFRDDFLAIRTYGAFVDAGKELAGDAVNDVRVTYRQDISRPIWQFDTLDDAIDLILIGGFWGGHSQKRAKILGEQIPCQIDNYSSYGEVGVSNLGNTALMVASYLAGCKSTLQWQTFMDAKALTVDGKPLAKPDRLAMLIYTKVRDKETGRMTLGDYKTPVLVSVRTKTLRRGQQDVELLAALQKKKGYSLEQMTALTRTFIGSGPTNQKAEFAEEAVGVNFSGLDAAAMEQFRMQLREALE